MLATLHVFLPSPASGQGTINTVAGNGTAGFSGDGFLATDAALFGPSGVSVDRLGDIFIADFANNNIREVFCANSAVSCAPPPGFVANDITTIAGNGTNGFGGDGGPATGAALNLPQSVSVDSSGNVFIADTANCLIRRVDAVTQIITTVAGLVSGGTNVCGYNGDGKPATSAALQFPNGVFVDRSGNIFVADTTNCLIRRVDAVTQIITTVAGVVPTGVKTFCGFSGDGGPATSAELRAPWGVAVDFSGNIFIADISNGRIREVAAATGIIQTVAGGGTGCAGQKDNVGDGCPATKAELQNPFEVAVDSSGDFFIADTTNNRIREVTASDGIIQTVAGNGTQGFRGDGLPSTYAELNQPNGVALDGSGNVLVADTNNSRIREFSTTPTVAPTVTLLPTSLTFFTEDVGTTSTAQVVTLINSGTETLNISSIALTGTNASEFKQTNTCGGIVAGLANCNITVTFSPSTTGAEGADVTIADDAGSGKQTVPLTGTGVDFSLSVSPSSASIAPGQTATFTITVAPGSTGFPTSVVFSASGSPPHSTVTFSPASVTPGANSATSTMTITAPAAGAQARPAPLQSGKFAFAMWFPLIFGITVVARSKKHRPSRWILGGALLLLFVLQIACGASGGGGPPPPTNYTVTVTGTSGATQHTTQVMVTVQ